MKDKKPIIKIFSLIHYGLASIAVTLCFSWNCLKYGAQKAQVKMQEQCRNFNHQHQELWE